MTEDRAKYVIDTPLSLTHLTARDLLRRDKTEREKGQSREDYISLLDSYKGYSFKDLPCYDRGQLVLAWLSVVDDAEQQIQKAHIETDLALLDIEQILDEPTLTPEEILEQRREALLGHFADTIQEHLENTLNAWVAD